MGILADAARKSTGYVQSTVDLFRELSRGRQTRSGKHVNIDTALEVTAVLSCVRVIAEGIAQVPLKLYQDIGRNKTPAVWHPMYSKLHRKPNPWMSSFEFRETMAIHAALTGNGVAFVSRMPGTRRIIEMIPLKPNRVRIEQDKSNALRYFVSSDDGKVVEFPQDAIWHWRGPSWDGVCGLEIIKLAREAIGLSIATEEAHAGLHKNGAKVSGLYSVDAKLNRDQYDALRKWIDENHAAEKSGGTMLLDNGAKFTSMTMSGVDAQHLETRRFQIEEICRAFRVMPIMAGYSDKAATYASAEQMFLAHVVHTLAPWYERIEQSIDCQLLTEREIDQGYYAKFVTAGLLRGSLEVTANVIDKYVNGGLMTPNEGREKLDMNPDSDPVSDRLRVPANIVGANPATPDGGTQK